MLLLDVKALRPHTRVFGHVLFLRFSNFIDNSVMCPCQGTQWGGVAGWGGGVGGWGGG